MKLKDIILDSLANKSERKKRNDDSDFSGEEEEGDESVVNEEK